MADLVVGLVKTVVEGALSKVKGAIEEEAKLRDSVRRNMVFITLEFEMIHSFLDDATQERVKSNLVKTWVRQVSNLAYDLEDCIDFVVQLDNKSTWYFLLLPSCMAPPLMLEVVQEIEEMRARAEELSKSYLRYSHIMDSDPKIFRLQQHISSSAAAGAVAVTMLMKARDATERQPCFWDLAQLITKKGVQDLQVISVWETVDGDLGTTSIISKAYSDPSFITYFTCRAWVKLMHPFNPRDFIRSLVAQFHSNSCEESRTVRMDVLTKMEATHEDLAKEFEQLVTHQRYLVVLEDLSSMVEWHAIRMFLPDMNNGSCIIVSTQRFEIASLCVGHPYQLTELKQFSAEHSVCALFKFKEDSQGDGQRGDEPMVCGLRQNSSYKKLQSKREADYDCGMNISPLVGRDLEMDVLLQYATIEPFGPSKVISVWGMAGVGKSALVRNIYNNRTSEQFGKYSWVDVSHPFNLNEFCRSMLFDIGSEKDPVEECRQLLNNHKCFVVIDDLQTTREWDMIQTALLSEHPISVIIAITSDARVATHCASKEELVFRVKSLENDVAIDLFRTQVHRKNPSSFLVHDSSAQLETLVQKCGGLPKVIVAVADVLAGEEVTSTDIVLSLNERFIQQLETKLEYDNLRGLFAWIDSIFRACPDSLKPCIFYLSIFRADLPIRRRRLVRRWNAEGYSRDNHEASANENGEKYFSNLLDLSLIQQQSEKIASATPGDRRMAMCKVNGFIHGYIVSRRMEENFVFELRGRCALTTQRTGRHLIIQECWHRDETVYSSIDLSHLRSLTVFGTWRHFFLSEEMRLLRVLDLEDAQGVSNDDFECMVAFLPRLKFLSLRGCMEVTRLPDSLGAMRLLETLDVRHTAIIELPAVIIRLQKLQYMRAGRSPPQLPPPGPPQEEEEEEEEEEEGGEGEEGRGAHDMRPSVQTTVLKSWASIGSWKKRWWPSKIVHRRCRVAANGGGVEVVPATVEGFGKLWGLHTLGVLNIAGGRGGVLRELRKLTQLRKLGLSGINHKNWQMLCSLISFGLPHLESLSLQLLVPEEYGASYEFPCFDDISGPPDTLKRLKVLYTSPAGRASIRLGWMKQLPHLERFDHELTVSNQWEIDSLMSDGFPAGQRENRFLRIMPDNEDLSFAKQTSRVVFLHVLMIDCSTRRSTVTFGESLGFSVEVVSIHCCSSCGGSSCLQIVGLQNIGRLEKVVVTGPCSDEFKQDLRTQLEEHQDKPELKLLPRN